jgi:nicotinamidase-related amidase
MAWSPLPEVVEVSVETPMPRVVTLNPAKTAVVVVDMQNTSRKSQRSVDVIEGNVTLLAKARESGAKVIHVQSLRQAESPEHTTYRRKLHRIVGSWDAGIMEEVAPLPGEPVIQKWSHDVWAWYGLEALLKKEGIVSGEWTVMVTGVSAAQCANACALGFANRHYDVLIPLDTTAAGIEAETRTYAHYMRGYEREIGFTLSTMVTFAPREAIAEPQPIAITV